MAHRIDILVKLANFYHPEYFEDCTAIGNSGHPLNQDCGTLLSVRGFDTR